VGRLSDAPMVFPKPVHTAELFFRAVHFLVKLGNLVESHVHFGVISGATRRLHHDWVSVGLSMEGRCVVNLGANDPSGSPHLLAGSADDL
jgi:hypothetical protein